jgi:O-antigen/teichoic acid export membrane protein
MINPGAQLQVDRLAGFAGFLFLAAVLFYPATFLKLFLSKALEFDKNMLIILALAGLVSAVLVSYANRAILEKKDRSYAIVTGIASIVSIALCIILSFFVPSAASIFAAIFAGELLSVLGLIILYRNWKDLARRAEIWAKYALFAAIPLAIRWGWGDTYLTCFSGLGLMGAAFLLVFHKKLRL